MTTHVIIEVIFSRKPLPARLAFVWFLSGMNTCVNDELGPAGEHLPAHFAMKGLFSSVNRPVVVEGAQASEFPSAFFTAVRLFTGMNSFMIRQAVGMSKSTTITYHLKGFSPV